MHLLTESVRDIRSDARIQEALEQELDGETERNKDDFTHCQMLEDHYKERGKGI